MMTKYEVMERVGAIWGEDAGRTVDAFFYQDKILVSWPEQGEHRTHVIDKNGHPTCHKACKQLETIAYERKLLI